MEHGKQALNDSAVACKGLKKSGKRIIFMLLANIEFFPERGLYILNVKQA